MPGKTERASNCGGWHLYTSLPTGGATLMLDSKGEGPVSNLVFVGSQRLFPSLDVPSGLRSCRTYFKGQTSHQAILKVHRSF